MRYNLPPAPAELPKSEAELEMALRVEDRGEEEPESDDIPRSLRPGQRGFAERLMSKYGWTKGSGLGASGSGIVNPLRVQVEKQKKKPDSEGGGFVGPGGRGKIIGGKKGGTTAAEGGKFGAMSEVIILEGMVDGMDLNAELESAGDGGLMQEIGEECGEKVSSNNKNNRKPTPQASIGYRMAHLYCSTVESRESSLIEAALRMPQSSSNLRISYRLCGYVSEPGLFRMRLTDPP